MASSRGQQNGFTLIELMIVVAIIGILAAIAIPNFMSFQMRARSAEGKGNLAAIRIAEEAYFAEFGGYVTAAINPTLPIGVEKRPWALLSAAMHGFNTLGWAPEGEVYFNYGVTANLGGGIAFVDFVAEAQADLDANMVSQTWGYVKPAPGAMVAAGPGPFGVCDVMGAWDSANMTRTLLATVSPCDDGMGQRIF